MTTVISVENLSKSYHLGQIGTGTFSRDLEVWWAKMRGKPNPMLRIGEKDHGNRDGEELWALKDVSFKVEQGEVLGIIGRNGAGKSTLLKILSRVTAPTFGKVKVKGRIASILEVGTGFHPELTGRENIYLNGAIMGMNRKEIDSKFDEIVDFSEVEKFIDTPVKRYSSGMYVRLAFAVAAHLDPEILVVDEVLAVGDAEFQKKCLGKMGDVAKEGRTVLFVSHQLNQIRRLCTKTLWVENGKAHKLDDTTKVVNAYENSAYSTQVASELEIDKKRSKAAFVKWDLSPAEVNSPNTLSDFENCSLSFILEVYERILNGHHGIALWSPSGQILWGWAIDNLNLLPGRYDFLHKLPGIPLRPGAYRLQVSLHENQKLIDNWHCVPDFIIDTKIQTHPRDEWSGILNFPNIFEICKLD